MTIWQRYSKSQREAYMQFLQVYGALTNLFHQKQGSPIPYLDSKFQETVFARVFDAQNVDIGNTPHDILSDFGSERIGIGLKTWMNTKPSFQKVMQLKRFQKEIQPLQQVGKEAELADKIASIKNERMIQDHHRLGLSESSNIYHYVTRDAGKLVLQETAYPLIDRTRLQDFALKANAFEFSDGIKRYKYTFADSQIWQWFDTEHPDTSVLTQIDVKMLDDPFEFLLQAYLDFYDQLAPTTDNDDQLVVAYLPMYAYRTKEVGEHSGLNAWNGKPKTKGSGRPRPSKEVYLPIPREFHNKIPNFFIKDIFEYEKDHKHIDFRLILPNGRDLPCKVTQQGMKGLQSGSQIEKDETGKRIGQAALGDWLLLEVLGLKEGQVVTKAWLEERGTDAVKIWRKKDDYSTFYMDFAPVGAFEAFMRGDAINLTDD